MQEQYNIDFLPQTKPINHIRATKAADKYLKQIEYLKTHTLIEVAYQTFKGV